MFPIFPDIEKSNSPKSIVVSTLPKGIKKPLVPS